MVKHIVLYTLIDGVDKEASVRFIASVLGPLVGKIPGHMHLEVCRAFAGMDYTLCSQFESQEALAAYAVHPPPFGCEKGVSSLAGKPCQRRLRNLRSNTYESDCYCCW